VNIGAEAALIRGKWLEEEVIFKLRYPKLYRNTILDLHLRKTRTSHEAKLLSEAKFNGVPVPSVLFINPEAGLLILEYVKGPKLRDIIDRIKLSECLEIFIKIGKNVGILHLNGIIHGDLTTSNMLLTEKNEVFFIDFGLGEFSNEVEKQGVDIHLMLRALESTHPSHARRLFEAFIKGYSSVRGEEWKEKILNKVREIRMRGRYISERRESHKQSKGFNNLS